METKLVKLKSDFNEIINIRNKVKNVFDTLHIRIDRLTQIYSEFIKTNKSETFVFGLDSFHFQSKLIDIEYDDMMRLFLAINNRMYCEYFKLHKIIVEYIFHSITDKKVSDLVKITNFPTYKDLEPFKEYKFETTLEIHENILNLLSMLMSILNNKENELSLHKMKLNIGLNIDNFITSFNFNINMMREKIYMFITYIEFFHKMHSKYLKRISNKIQLMYTHISNDIKFDDSVEITKNKKKELLNEFATKDMDKALLNDLKTSIGSETNSDVSSSDSKNSLTSNSETSILDSFLITNPLKDDKGMIDKGMIDKGMIDKGMIDKSMIDKGMIDKSMIIDNKSKDNGKVKYRKMFKNNVHKVTDMFQLFKPKKDKMLDSPLSDKDIKDIFYGIDESCDSIIYEKPATNDIANDIPIDIAIDIDNDIHDMDKNTIIDIGLDIEYDDRDNLGNPVINDYVFEDIVEKAVL
jgi:hypothetical protein